MKFPALETKELNRLCSAIIENIQLGKVDRDELPEMVFAEGSFFDDLVYDEDLEVVLAHLKKHKVIKGYEVNQDTETPIQFIKNVVLKGIDYGFTAKLYDNALSVIRINLNCTNVDDVSTERILS